MGLSKNSENRIMLSPVSGKHTEKKYVFKESNKRFSLLRLYVKNRTKNFKHYYYFCITDLTPEGKWAYGNYSMGPSSENLPIPEVIYDIQHDKVYELEGQLWELPDYIILDIEEIIESEKHQ